MNSVTTGAGDTSAPYDFKHNERRQRARSSGFPLQLNITSVFALILATTIISVVAFAYYKNTNSVLDLTERFMARVAEGSINESVAMFKPVTEAVKTTAVFTEQTEEATRNGAIFPYFRTVLQNNPQVQSIYIGFQDDGRFVQGYSVPPNATKFGPNDAEPPQGAVIAYRVVDRNNGGYLDSWTYVDQDGQVVGSETSTTTNYDPRQRPFYGEAVKADKLVLTDLLVYASNRQPGVTATTPIHGPDGRLIGVAAANVSTNQLSDFMSRLDLGSGGVALIIDEANHAVAYPDASRTVHQNGSTLVLTQAGDLGDPRVASAMLAWHQAPSHTVRFQNGDLNYMASFSPFPARFGKQWTLVSIVLENDFVGTFKANTRDILLVSGAFLFVSMVLIAFLSHWLSKPLSQLSVEIQKIQKFDLAEPIVLYSAISEVNGLINSMNMMKRALRTFGMFVPRDLVRELVGSGRPIELGGHDRELTVMFTDIADFSALSERMPHGELLVHVSRHLAAISECVGEEYGTVDKYIGDAVMAFWGAPAPLADHAVHGCIAALKAKYIQDQMNAEWRQNGLPALYIRIGLHTSQVIVGNIGSVQRMSYTAVGDGVNVASRLEGVNKVYGTQICISQSVLDATQGQFVARPLDKVAVKGRVAGETVYELMGMVTGYPHLTCTPQQVEICSLTQQAFAAYQAQDWQQAIQLYQQLAQLDPQDKVPALFINRCQQYQIAPPQNWDGVYKLESK